MSLYIDESYSLPRVNFNSSYVLSAVRIEPHDEISIRAIMMELKLPTEFKVHWRKSSSKRKNLLINSLADLSLANITVARLSTTSERTERQRRKALERLLFESTSPSAEKVVLESRGAGDDRKDIDFISMLRRNSKTDIMTEITHVRGAYRTAPMDCRHRVWRRFRTPKWAIRILGETRDAFPKQAD